MLYFFYTSVSRKQIMCLDNQLTIANTRKKKSWRNILFLSDSSRTLCANSKTNSQVRPYRLHFNGSSRMTFSFGLFRLFVRGVPAEHNHHDGNKKTVQFRGGVRVGFVRLQGPQHGGAERSHVTALEGLPGRQRCLRGAGWVTGRTSKRAMPPQNAVTNVLFLSLAK